MDPSTIDLSKIWLTGSAVIGSVAVAPTIYDYILPIISYIKRRLGS